jgi:hypothetical protein
VDMEEYARSLATGATGLRTPLQKRKNTEQVCTDPLLPLPGLCPPFRVLVPETYPCCRWFRGWATLGPQPPRRGRQKRKEDQAKERPPGPPNPRAEKASRRRTTTGHCPVPVLSRSAKTSFPGRKDHSAALRGPSRPKPKRTRPCRAHWLDCAPSCLGPPGPPEPSRCVFSRCLVEAPLPAPRGGGQRLPAAVGRLTEAWGGAEKEWTQGTPPARKPPGRLHVPKLPEVTPTPFKWRSGARLKLKPSLVPIRFQYIAVPGLKLHLHGGRVR